MTHKLQVGDKVIKPIFTGDFLTLKVLSRSTKTVDTITENGYDFGNIKIRDVKLYDKEKATRLRELLQKIKTTRKEIDDIYNSLEGVE